MTEPVFQYRIPTTADAPPAIVDRQRMFSSLTPEQMAERIGIYCEEASHEGQPWLIGSMALSPEVKAQTGRDYWTVIPKFIIGTGQQLSAPGVQAQTMIGDRRIPTDDDGLPILAGEDYSQARTRYRMGCARCGRTLTTRQETLQKVAVRLQADGLREVTLSFLAAAVHRLA
ncbi:hypothetical protein [Micrococcus luteus]|uniref:hypothetical protein n=1 Tax=Micrococcus luteus TaxID=1270 RepID=UPI0011A0448C|nr:hypothetical protein [Micrococcus luteus]MCV7499224.1 hypothetical protein [Micrococcus luteus]